MPRIREPQYPPEWFVRNDGTGPFGINDASAIMTCDRSIRHLLSMMRGDAAKIRSNWNEGVLRRAYPTLFIAWSHRICHWLHINRLKPLALMGMWACHAVTGAEIRPGAVLGPGLLVVHPTGVLINGGAIAGPGLQLYGANCIGANLSYGLHGTPKLGADVTLSHGSMAMGPILIGDGAVVGAMSLVLHDVAPGAKVKGTPAR